MGLDRLVLQTQIRQVVWQTERALLDVISVWARHQCCGLVKSRNPLR